MTSPKILIADDEPSIRRALSNVFRKNQFDVLIKWAAGFLSLDTIKELSHVMETLLQMIRTGEIKPFPTVIVPLLEGADLLKSMVNDIGASNSIDIKALLWPVTPPLLDEGSVFANAMPAKLNLTPKAIGSVCISPHHQHPDQLKSTSTEKRSLAP